MFSSSEKLFFSCALLVVFFIIIIKEKQKVNQLKINPKPCALSALKNQILIPLGFPTRYLDIFLLMLVGRMVT